MITDIYLQKPGDPTYTEDGAIELEEFAILLAQIKMTLLTPTRSVLGESQYGVNEENLLFTFSDTFALGLPKSSFNISISLKILEAINIVRLKNDGL
jgi:hypothetical protein